MDVVRGERAKVCGQGQQRGVVLMKPTFKKVQIVYYLSRNGHLEHPHFMEVTHLAHQHLRLKDVMDRLTALRGKGMPLLYSWSCKRSYKNGYVWNDVAENDIIYPSEGAAEYVLKGSELIQGCTDKLHRLQVGNLNTRHGVHDSNLQPKPKSNPEEMVNNNKYDDEIEEYEEEEYEEKRSYTTTSSTTPHSRCSRGVSTDEIEQFKPQKSPDSNACPDIKVTTTATCKPRFEDGDPVTSEPLFSRNSMLLSLIACGGSVSFRKAAPPLVVAKQSPRKSTDGNLHKDKDEDEIMIGTMSENPRFGNLQAEEKEYFSGSIVECITAARVEAVPGLKKSSSHNEERSKMGGLGEAVEDEVEEKENGVKGKCIPRKKKKSPCSKQLNKK